MMRTSDPMPRGARLAATLLVLCTGGCVDLSMPPELRQMEPDSGQTTSAPDTNPGPSGTEPDAAESVVDAPEADRQPDADTPDAGADGAAADAAAGDLPRPDGPGVDGGDGRPPDGAAAPLVIDDFSDGTVSPNTLGAPVAGDNQLMAVANGELSFYWNSSSVFQSFRELLAPTSCARDIRGYRTFRFRMRATMPGREVKIFLGRTNATCTNRTFVSLGSISPTATMTTFSIDLQTVDREHAASFEWQPPADGTVYFVDDIQLVP
jgi:hypothetical protein